MRKLSFNFCKLPLLAGLLACQRDATAPGQHGPPYLAIVTDLTALTGVVPPGRITYHVTELSGTLGIDRRFDIAPTDTVVMSVKPATYVVDLENIPTTCFVRGGPEQAIVLSDQDNTGIIRYSIQCRGALNVETLTDGYDADSSFVYRLTEPGGVEKLGLIGANDTLVFNGLPPGTYTFQIAGVAPNCVVTSPGGSEQTFDLEPAGGTSLQFRVQCSRESDRPQILSFESSYVLGSSAFVLKVYDPTRDVTGYDWDLTDCNGHSVLPERRGKTRTGLLDGRTRLQDTLLIVGAYDVGLPEDSLRSRCAKIRVFDYEANSSPIVEKRIGPSGGQPPVVTFFNSFLVGTQQVQTTLTATDPDNDIAGVFVAVRLRDGTLGPTDGLPDLGIMDPAGYRTTDIPPIPTTGRIAWDAVYAVIIWVIDSHGNAVRFEDGNIFQ